MKKIVLATTLASILALGASADVNTTTTDLGMEKTEVFGTTINGKVRQFVDVEMEIVGAIGEDDVVKQTLRYYNSEAQQMVTHDETAQMESGSPQIWLNYGYNIQVNEMMSVEARGGLMVPRSDQKIGVRAGIRGYADVTDLVPELAKAGGRVELFAGAFYEYGKDGDKNFNGSADITADDGTDLGTYPGTATAHLDKMTAIGTEVGVRQTDLMGIKNLTGSVSYKFKNADYTLTTTQHTNTDQPQMFNYSHSQLEGSLAFGIGYKF